MKTKTAALALFVILSTCTGFCMEHTPEAAHTPMATTSYLNPADRPFDVREKIDEAFLSLSQQANSTWNCNGNEATYDMLQFNEHTLVRHLILNSANQIEFNFLDLGAGNFGWGKALTTFLDQDKDVQIHLTTTDAVINIIGVRREQHSDAPCMSVGQINRYEFGGFKVEEIASEFANERFAPHGFNGKKMDMIVAHFCLHHLVDPLGTFLQTYDMLKLNGWLFFNNFFFRTTDENTSKDSKLIDRTFEILDYTGASFIMKPLINMRKHEIILQKETEDLLQLPFQYISTCETPIGHPFQSETVTTFRHTGERRKIFPELKMGHPSLIYGDHKLHDWFIENSFLPQVPSPDLFIQVDRNI